MSSPQSLGGPRAGETGGGSSGSPRCVRIFRIGPGSRWLEGRQPRFRRRHNENPPQARPVRAMTQVAGSGTAVKATKAPDGR